MDRDWMHEQLEFFDHLVTQYWNVRYANGDTTEERKNLFEAEPTVVRILRRLNPDMPDVEVLGQSDWGDLTTNVDEVRRGIGILADMDEWKTRLAPDSPSLPADRLHPWVWDAARTFWESAHYRAAVPAAATSINAHLQNKLGRRDLSDAKLVQEAFSDKAPETGKPRLRIPGAQTDPGVQTRQRGALQLGQGAFFALRNPAAHETGDLAEQDALEQLATFSVVARLIDQCQVET
ncbi:TIGR02391 family protein [Streptomyces malaysiensis]|uniref:TIGR02391 family protein n=1 Tax=Streptomyces malaysiensis TaxID=92644 RepID=UPI0032203C93|nr:TIGR02391 family protein [Streptomyces malaysiensis]